MLTSQTWRLTRRQKLLHFTQRTLTINFPNDNSYPLYPVLSS